MLCRHTDTTAMPSLLSNTWPTIGGIYLAMVDKSETFSIEADNAELRPRFAWLAWPESHIVSRVVSARYALLSSSLSIAGTNASSTSNFTQLIQPISWISYRPSFGHSHLLAQFFLKHRWSAYLLRAVGGDISLSASSGESAHFPARPSPFSMREKGVKRSQVEARPLREPVGQSIWQGAFSVRQPRDIPARKRIRYLRKRETKQSQRGSYL